MFYKGENVLKCDLIVGMKRPGYIMQIDPSSFNLFASTTILDAVAGKLGREYTKA